MLAVMEDDSTSSEVLETLPSVDALGLLYGNQEYSHEVWINHFDNYFEFLCLIKNF